MYLPARITLDFLSGKAALTSHPVARSVPRTGKKDVPQPVKSSRIANLNIVPNTPEPSTVQGIDVQLDITETITFAEFNARVAVDPNYPTNVHLNGLRILVILPDFQDTTNRNLADIVMFVKQGIASVESCRFGPPGFSIDVQRLNIWNLTYSLRPRNEVCWPFPGYLKPPQTQTPENPRPHEHLDRHRPEGLGDLELFGVEAMESQHGRQDSAFGGDIAGGDIAGGGDFGAEGDEGED
ncbi:unnamed protein product [Sphagnum balticum]